jgi:vacuolar-type H+-ATPase subunit I/STV1
VPRQVKREKAVYHTLNKLSVDVTRKVLVAEAWMPAPGKHRVQEALRAVHESSNTNVSARAGHRRCCFTKNLRSLGGAVLRCTAVRGGA